MPNNATVFAPDATISPTWLKEMMAAQASAVPTPSPSILPSSVAKPAGAGNVAATVAASTAAGAVPTQLPSDEEIERNRQLAAAGDKRAIDWLRTLGLIGGVGAGAGALAYALRGRTKKGSEIKAAAESNTPKSLPITPQNAKTQAVVSEPVKKNVPSIKVTSVQEEPITYLPPQRLLPRGQKIPKVSQAMRAILALP